MVSPDRDDEIAAATVKLHQLRHPQGRAHECFCSTWAAELVDELRALRQPPELDVVVHACPPDGSGIMRCCGLTPFEASADRITLDPSLVTCPGDGVRWPAARP